jgi:ATP-dependent DNA helicase RecG
MNQSELLQKLEELRHLPHEIEWVEFKEANNKQHLNTIGEYFSALSNEANLKNQPCGWLIFGVVDNDHSICGSRFRENPKVLDSLKHEVSAHTTGNLTFLDIHVVNHPDGRVVMFQIPPAPQGVPTAWRGHWYGRDGESIGALNLHELETIRAQVTNEDWSAGVCVDATLDDLDEQAIAAARANFRAKNQDKPFASEIDSWSIEAFLDRAKITSGGRITRTALLLLGRPEAARHLQSAVAQITWQLKGEEQAYEHFGPPLLLTTSNLYSRIRNNLQKIDLPHRLVPLEVLKYEKSVVLEALHNAIVHQDYNLQSRVNVTEMIGQLQFESAGGFFEGELADYTLGEKTPMRYRNRFLADAMVNVNMIDTMGYGIRKMFSEQRKRHFPLPDYDLSDPGKVQLTIYGRLIDENYTRLLIEKDDLPLSIVILLDRVQKNQRITKEDHQKLRREKLVEGRYPNLFVAAQVAASTERRADYIRHRAFDDDHYKKLIIDYLMKFYEAGKDDINRLLEGKLSDALDEKQKYNKIRNLLQAMRRDNLIKNEGSKSNPKWMLAESTSRNS